MSKARPLSVRSWPQAILHIDGDSFFAACEQAMHTEYRGKPLVVGGERGIATAMSVEAKALGITRGMQNHEIKREHPECIIVPSDYETYSLMSVRMFDIVRRHTPVVEEYSIDECFANLTGLRRARRGSYEEIAKTIKAELQRDLGITFSAGLAPSKVVAKIATGWRKPNGFTAIKAKHIHHVLQKMPVGKVWGIGPQTASQLEKWGIRTALEFAQMEEDWVVESLAKPYVEIWHELHGHSIKKVITEKESPKSVSKTKTFTPPSTDRSYVHSQLSKNIENACIRMRRHDVYADMVAIYLKHQDFTSRGRKFKLSMHTNAPNEILRVTKPVFDELFVEGKQYRATGVRLSNLVYKESFQKDLFNQHIKVEKLSNLFEVIDGIDARFGKHTVYLGSSSEAITRGNYQGERGKPAERKEDLLAGETIRQRISVPYLGTVT